MENEITFKNGTLLAVDYGFKSGTLYGADFFAKIISNKIVKAEYCLNECKECSSGKVENENVAITDEQWSLVKKAIKGIEEILVEIPMKPAPRPLGENIFILDGGDKEHFYLTWGTPDGEKTIKYSIPNDRRFTTLIALIKEIVCPAGREIVWYGAPEITGMYMIDKTLGKENSYQCTQWEDENKWYFIMYYYEGSERKSLSKFVDEKSWNRILNVLNSHKSTEYPEGSRKMSKCSLTLYMSDGKQPIVEPDTDTINEIVEVFGELKELSV
ncbi:MAG: hypothetical protein K6G11_04875 [Lachnospiraceae bacterium]|nr:hypothetical protein [Lachnospiraceae bacterium]